MDLIPEDILRCTRRNLPHWQADGYSYFITARSHITLHDPEKMLIVKHLMHDHGKRYELHVGVVMDDHFHIIIRPLVGPDVRSYGLDRIMQGIKRSSARSINKLLGRSGSLWQDESFDRLIRNEKEYLQKWHYIVNNPVNAGLADHIDEYPFLIRPMMEDGSVAIAGPQVVSSAGS